ncbi:unnamed protein product [Hymenolepis diminuta]|uniref:Uncharacterized protein n=1 Tax=Hymenolepis diminuta TaxID=6216 RepID=A0A564YMS1_HYMDI|nr:unnamed protein product [Hymenolepis diminuta]
MASQAPLVLLLLNLIFFSSAGVIESDRFEACLVICSQRYRDCLQKANGLWRDFYNNMDIIRKIANKCCLFRATSQRAAETDSFSACARIRCKASLWGCEIRKKHWGEISDSERRHLEEEMLYGNYTIPR